uniref:Uncharacterized protein n=1 Tax=viral metagenome TaxID=1070528 RepID=A0A6C0HS39_9ZZZZ
MEVFVVMQFNSCDDDFYRYDLVSIFPTYKDAKKYVDTFLSENKHFNKDNKDYISYGRPFIRIIKMEFGGTNKEIVFDSFLL